MAFALKLSGCVGRRQQTQPVGVGDLSIVEKYRARLKNGNRQSHKFSTSWYNKQGWGASVSLLNSPFRGGVSRVNFHSSDLYILWFPLPFIHIQFCHLTLCSVCPPHSHFSSSSIAYSLKSCIAFNFQLSFVCFHPKYLLSLWYFQIMQIPMPLMNIMLNILFFCCLSL